MRLEVANNGALPHQRDRDKMKTMHSTESRYLLRTNLAADEPELIWRCYMQLSFVGEAFRTLKGDLGLQPIYRQKAERIEAHPFVAFLAYCLSVTTEPSTDVPLLLAQLGLTLPPQPPPKIRYPATQSPM